MIAEHDAVQPQTLTAADDELAKVEAHEAAAHEKRNWVRLSYDCNNKCTFCLDSLAHVGTMRSNLDIKIQIIEGRKKGASRLILSGGEPTMHPNFLDFVKLGKRAGYPKVQTVTNGRMFAYPDFLESSAKNGLDEITFSLHGHYAKLHDRLVGVPGAFEQESAGLKAALASGRFIVNVDIVINKQNVQALPEMLDTFIGWGVQEFDLLHIIPFGNAWGAAKEHLFYDLDGNEAALRKAFSYSQRPDIHIWLNRFPPPFTEGFEELIQDPYKLNDEVRGRREEYEVYLKEGRKLSCRQPDRCHYCYMNQLCDGLDQALDESKLTKLNVIRVEAPAPMAGALPPTESLRVVAPNLGAAKDLATRADAKQLWLELGDYAGLDDAMAKSEERGHVFGRKLERCYASTSQQLATLLASTQDVRIVVMLNGDTARALHALPALPEQLTVAQPNYDRVTDQIQADVDLRAFCARLPSNVRTENIPACLSGRAPERHGATLDAAMLSADGRIDMPSYTKRYIADRYYTKSRRCAQCLHDDACEGVHINFVRAHGYAQLEPVREDAQ